MPKTNVPGQNANSRTGSSKGYYTRNGEKVAICHPVKKVPPAVPPTSGTSAPPPRPAHASLVTPENCARARVGRPALTAASPRRAGTHKASYKDPTKVSDDLTPYHWNAPRSRYTPQFENEARPMVRFCQPRNVSNPNMLAGYVHAGYERFRTTSQNYFDYDTKATAVGETNPGIVSELSKSVHYKQTL